MRHVKFILSALAILLAGALAVGLAARAVVAPRAGETVSAGVVSVPPVLGQSTEEVLFYPWSLYDTLTLEPCFPCLDSEEELQAVKENARPFPIAFLPPSLCSMSSLMRTPRSEQPSAPSSDARKAI